MSYVIVTGDFVRTGGMDVANYGLADWVARRGEEVHLVAHRAAPELVARPNVELHRVPRPLGMHVVGAPLLAATGARVAARHRGATFVANGGNCVSPGVNWVHYVHAAWPMPGGGRGLRRIKRRVEGPLRLATERKALQAARLVIVNSDRTGRDVIERVGVRPERVKTVYYGIDASRFATVTEEERAGARAHMRWSSDRPVVVFVGALGDRRKGFDTLLSAWKRLSARGSWDARLAVVGVGANLEVWRQDAARSSLDMEFLGFRDDVPRVLAAADALVSPTRYEAYGLGVHEALCRGLPAIVSASSGVAERYPPDLRSLLIDDVEDSLEVERRLVAWREDAAGLSRRVRAFGAGLVRRSWDDMASDIDAAARAAGL